MAEEDRRRRLFPDFGGDDQLDELDLDDDDLDDYDLDLPAVAVEVLVEEGPLSAEELGRHLAALGFDADDDDIDDVKSDPLVVLLADERLASVPALLAATVFTHRLTDDEAANEAIPFGVDLDLVLPMVCGDDHVHLTGGQVATLSEELDPGGFAGDIRIEGPAGWLGGAAGGQLVGFRLRAGVGPSDDVRLGPEADEWLDAELEVVPVAGEVPVPDTLGAQLAAGFRRFGEGDGMPLRPLELICQLAVDAPALVTGVMPPVSQVLEQAGFETRGGYAAPAGTDWETFDRLRKTASVAVRRSLTADQGHALVLVSELARACRVQGFGALDRDVARDVGRLLASPDVVEAFADATAEHPEATMDFLAQARGLAGRRVASSMAWAESIVAGRAGAVGRAESCLAEALAADPHDDQVLEDAAWYASDRGDAAQAVRYLDRMDEDLDEDRTRLLRRYAAPTSPTGHTGRNEPCPCGSGRKYKHCCLGGRSTLDHPLPDRVRWLWEKMRWWLDRSGRDDDVLDVALELHGGLPAGDNIEFGVDFDMAASLVLFADGAIHDFLRERGGLLPDDETNLVAQWALTERSVHEVVEVRPGDGFSLRDLRTGDVAEVRERRGAAQLAPGNLICAHPVFDGQGQQVIGGIVPVPGYLREPLMTALDAHASSIDLGWILGATRRPPDVVNMEGQPTVTGAGVPPGAEEPLAAFMRQQEERWVDEPVPALSGLSPRQAAADPTRREDLLALLHEFDRHTPPPGAATFDTARLRRLLGLPVGTSP
jgi:hypothetical protein